MASFQRGFAVPDFNEGNSNYRRNSNHTKHVRTCSKISAVQDHGIRQKVRVNVLMETYHIIGFVLIEEYRRDSLTLSNIRNCIKSQFDEDQLQVLGSADSFSFMMNSIPISKKQETFITVQEIAVSETNTDDPMLTRLDSNESRSRFEHKKKHTLSAPLSRQDSLSTPITRQMFIDSYYEGSTDITHNHNLCLSIIVRIALRTTKHHSNRTLSIPTTGDDGINIFDTLNHDHPHAELEDMKFDTDEGTDSTGSETSEEYSHSGIPQRKRKTRLELQFGAKLPKIRATKSKNKPRETDYVQMTNVLGRALVSDQLQPMKSLRRCKNSDSTLLPLPEDSYGEDILEDDRCRFTVVGSPRDNIGCRKKRTWIFYNAKELVLGLPGVYHSEKAPIWIDLVCDHDAFRMISDHIRPLIHNLTIEDCVTVECREKLELFEKYLFICVHCSYTERLYMIVFKTMIITYHTDMRQSVDAVITEARNRLEKRHEIRCSSPGWIVHTIMDVIVDRMIPEVETRVQEVQNVEQLVFALSGLSHNELIQRLQRARNWLIVCRSRLWPKSTMTHNFKEMEWREFIGGVQQQYWNDIHDHVSRMVDLMSLGQSALDRCQSVFVAKIGLEMTNQSNKLNDAAGRLTAVGSVFLPLTFLAGVWGMNCKVPFQYEGPEGINLFTNDYYGFFIVVTMMIAMTYITYKYVSQIP